MTGKRHEGEFKAKVVLEAIPGEQTLAVSAKHGICQAMIAAWKQQVIEGLASTFCSVAMQVTKAAELTRLHASTGQLMLE